MTSSYPQLFKSLFNRLLQLSSRCTFIEYHIPHSCRYRKLLHFSSSSLHQIIKKTFIQRTKVSWFHLFLLFSHENSLYEYLHTAHDNGCCPVESYCSFTFTTPRCVRRIPIFFSTKQELSIIFLSVTIPLLRFIYVYLTILENNCQPLL